MTKESILQSAIEKAEECLCRRTKDGLRMDIWCPKHDEIIIPN